MKVNVDDAKTNFNAFSRVILAWRVECCFVIRKDWTMRILVELRAGCYATGEHMRSHRIRTFISRAHSFASAFSRRGHFWHSHQASRAGSTTGRSSGPDFLSSFIHSSDHTVEKHYFDLRLNFFQRTQSFVGKNRAR